MVPPIRRLGYPEDAPAPVSLFRVDAELKAHPSYRAAKAGDEGAAVRLVFDIARPLAERVAKLHSPGVRFVAPMLSIQAGMMLFRKGLSARWLRLRMGYRTSRLFRTHPCFTLALIRWRG